MRRLVLALAVAMVAAGCTLSEPAPAVTPTVTSTPATTTPPASTPTITTPPTTPAPQGQAFDGGRAMEHVTAQITAADGGPRYRVPGTQGNADVAAYITTTMEALGYDVAWHHFNASYGCDTVAMHNVVATRAGTSGRVVAFAAHYDTRPVADKDPDITRQGQPILGANDGASGVAVLLELARVLGPSDDEVRFLFFDGEDGGGRWSGCSTDWILGSRAYAESLSAEEVASFRALVLVDMVGDPQLILPREAHSMDDERGRIVQDEIYALAGRMGHSQFRDVRGAAVLDDHVPFLERDVAAVDLIHTIPGDRKVFPAWHHTHADDADVVSPISLHVVGRVVEAWFESLD